MRIKICFIAILILAVLFSVPAYAQGSSWFVRREKDHVQPSVSGELERLLVDFDGYYVDKRCGTGADDKVIYLTFDAGYENGNVSRILDVLREEKVHGAFFILSHLVLSAPDVVKRIHSEGHLLCNHTAHHKDMTALSACEIEKEISSLGKTCQETLGLRLSPFFRPPEGKYDQKTLKIAKELGYKTVFWSLAYADWNDDVAPCDEKAIQLLKDNTHTGAIVLLHPTSDINVRILKDMIHYWREQGYRFGSLEELKGE